MSILHYSLVLARAKNMSLFLQNLTPGLAASFVVCVVLCPFSLSLFSVVSYIVHAFHNEHGSPNIDTIFQMN